ncbi:MAG TPA: hypothetical protein VFF76_03720 [Holophagaceae bacterium]|nr:hypothetical protein [Holophagaceae bacterium]
MIAWPFPSHRNPVWRTLGWITIGSAIALTGLFMLQGPRRLLGQTGTGLFDPGMSGSRGSLSEAMGNGRMVLNYQTLEGTDEDLKLKGVTGQLLDSTGLWHLKAPSARRLDQAWTLDGALDLDLVDGAGDSLGQGRVTGTGGAMLWKDGVWTGLQPLLWESRQGASSGEWHLPAGWTRQADGRFRVEQGGVRWVAADAGTLRSMDAAKLWATPGFAEGHLEQAVATLSGGVIRAATADLDPQTVRWPAPLSFTRDDGWRGTAAGGEAPRPAPGAAFQRVELRTFHADRKGSDGLEKLDAAGARWTPAGLRLEGSVTWTQTYQGAPLKLQGPTILMRNGPGEDLPKDLPAGHAMADGRPVLTWGNRSLSSPRMEVDRVTRRWKLDAPTLGRGADGTFSGAAAEGTPAAWTVAGPVNLALAGGGQLRGNQLLWEAGAWTLRGNPATWTRLQERLSGPRIIRAGDRLDFPDGLQGAEAGPDGDLTVRAAQGHGDGQSLLLGGGVACTGPGWRVEAPAITVTFGPGHVVKAIHASGGASLKGRYGEGKGEALDMAFGAGAPPVVRWQGRVRGEGETSW